MKETKSKSISDLFVDLARQTDQTTQTIVPTPEQFRKTFEEQKKDENVLSGKKEKLEEKGKAPEQSVPTPFQKNEQTEQDNSSNESNVLAKSVWSAKMIKEYDLKPRELKEIGVGTVEGIGGRFFRKKIEGKPSTEKPIEIWFDPEEGGINDFIDRKLSEGFNFVPLRAIEMETGEILTVSCDRRIPCSIGRNVKVSAQISETGFVNFSLKVIRNKRKEN